MTYSLTLFRTFLHHHAYIYIVVGTLLLLYDKTFKYFVVYRFLLYSSTYFYCYNGLLE
jgi:hypothetical protein